MEDASVTHKLGVSKKIFNVIFFLSFIFHKQYKFPQQQFVQKNKNKDDELLMAFGVTLDYKKKIRGLSWSCHNITEILLKVALNIIKPNQTKRISIMIRYYFKNLYCVEFDLKGLLLSDLKLLGFLLHLVTHRQKLISLNLKKNKTK